jgi:hypothetical protein
MATRRDDETPQLPAQYTLSREDLTTLLQGVIAASKMGTDAQPTAPGMTEAMTALLTQVEKLTQTAQRGVRHENPHYEDVSVYTVDPKCDLCKTGGLHFINEDPIGKKAHPRPTMKYEFMFCQGLVMADWLTIPEVELVNQFMHDKTSRNGAWTASVDRNGTKVRLVVDVPFRGLDTRHDLPSLSAILVELLYGESLADPSQAIALIQQLQRKVDDLEARLASRQ